MTHQDLTNAHRAINDALKTATAEQASELLLQRRELNLISAAQEREALKAECQAAEITLTNNELKTIYTIDGGEPITGAELDELNEGDQDTRAAIRAAYRGESHTNGHAAQIELYTEPTPRRLVKTSQGARHMSHKTPSPIQHNDDIDTHAKPTLYNLPTLATLQAQARQVENTETETEARGVVTELELASLAVIDAAELISEPLTPHNVARLFTKGAAYLARLARG
jgi:hypothetical protein